MMWLVMGAGLGILRGIILGFWRAYRFSTKGRKRYCAPILPATLAEQGPVLSI
jgi:hypothetical protein